VIHVPYRAYVDVRFGALKFALCHDFSLINVKR
jgi:hypothetical protein